MHAGESMTVDASGVAVAAGGRAAAAGRPGLALRPAAFLDRDGVLNIDTGYVHKPSELALIEGAGAAIARLNRCGYLVIVVTNQSGVARGYFTIEEMDRFHDHLRRALAAEGGVIDAIYACPYHPDAPLQEWRADHEDRKPRPGMIVKAMAAWPVRAEGSFLVGDKQSDVDAAAAAGIAGHLFGGGNLDEFIAPLVRAPKE